MLKAHLDLGDDSSLADVEYEVEKISQDENGKSTTTPVKRQALSYESKDKVLTPFRRCLLLCSALVLPFASSFCSGSAETVC